MKRNYILCLTIVAALMCACSDNNNDNGGETPGTPLDVDIYVTTANQSKKFDYATVAYNEKQNMSPYTITLDPTVTYQEMDGFGAAITGSSCYNLLKMSPENRSKLLNETFDSKTGMGYSYIRISIGCSDFSLAEYTCCDTKGIANFAIHELDKRDLIPVIKEIQAINPKIKIMASPWTCPKWMKVDNLTNKNPYDSWTGGQLNPDYYADYATYFVKFIGAMQTEGIAIESVTIQNEPLNRGNSASLYMTWQEQRDFIKTALGPAFKTAGISTKIIAFDHNYNYDNIEDQKSYPTKIYADPEAAAYIHGAAYHAYGGDKSELLNVHNTNPSKGLYFTEISIGTWGYSFEADLMWNMREVGIGTINNYCKAVMVWNYMLDSNRGPNRPGGCTTCYGAVDIASDFATTKKNSHYYAMGHLSKVIKPGAKRIKISGYQPDGLHYSAFENPDNTYSAVLLNETVNSLSITIADPAHTFTYSVPAKSVISYIWKK